MTKARDLANAGTALGAVSATELAFVDGVTSAIQTQIDSKIGSASAINPTVVDAKGDIIAATAADTVARLAVGANGTVLTAASGQATGLEWATVAAGSNWSLLNSGGTALTGAQTVTVSGISGKDKIMVILQSASSASSGSYISVRLNTDTASNYYQWGVNLLSPSSYSQNSLECSTGADSKIYIGRMSNNATSGVNGYVQLSGCNSSGVKVFSQAGSGRPATGSNHEAYMTGGYYDSASTISSISVNSSSGDLDNGTVYVYTSA